MSRLQLPRSPTDVLKLADWLEVLALISADENSSKGDLEEALRASSVLERSSSENTDELIEKKCIDVFSEIEQRILSSGAAYPYQLEGGVLQLTPDRAKSHPYLFCLCLSYFDWSTPGSAKKAGIDPRLLFEELCSVAAAHYTSGESMTFGTSRGNSKKALATLRRRLIQCASN